MGADVMSRFRWLGSRKCLETMETFSSLEGQTYEAMEKLLFDAVARGDIRATLNDEIVPKAHIGMYLSLYRLSNPGQEPNTVPPDVALSYDDLCAIFDRPVIDSRKRGRPAKEASGWSSDRLLAYEMHRMIAGDPSVSRANSAAEAARILVALGRVPGAGSPESLAKRLERTFRKYYSS